MIAEKFERSEHRSFAPLAGAIHSNNGCRLWAVNDNAFPVAANDNCNPSQITGRTVSNAAYEWSVAADFTDNYADNNLNQITSKDGAAFTHDARGNTIDDAAETYTYDADNRMIEGGTGTETYDPAGRLYQIVSGGVTQRFLYAGPQIVAEYNQSNVLQRRFVAGGLDEPLVWLEGTGTGNRKWHLADERGSVIALANATAGVTAINRYDPFGVQPAGGANTGRFRYTGSPWIGSAGLHHMRVRAYSAENGRFMQADPIGYAGGMNLYGYVGNDPINFTDPFGLCSTGSRIPSGNSGPNGGGQPCYTTFVNSSRNSNRSGEDYGGRLPPAYGTISCFGVCTGGGGGTSSGDEIIVTGTNFGSAFGIGTSGYIDQIVVSGVREGALAYGRELTASFVSIYSASDPNFHEYELLTRLCLLSQDNCAALGLAAIAANSIPLCLFCEGPGDYTLLPFQPITHSVFGNIFVNDTRPGHIFHPGSVIHAGFEYAGGYYFYSRGVGAGGNPGFNSVFGTALFSQSHASALSIVQFFINPSIRF